MIARSLPRVSAFFVISIIFLYVLYFHRATLSEQAGHLTENLNDNIGEKITWLTGGGSGDEVEDDALFLAQGMQSWMNHSLDVSDFARKGDRVHALSGLMATVKKHPTNKLKAKLREALGVEFPWWYMEEDEYLPWEHQSWVAKPSWVQE